MEPREVEEIPRRVRRAAQQRANERLEPVAILRHGRGFVLRLASETPSELWLDVVDPEE